MKERFEFAAAVGIADDKIKRRLSRGGLMVSVTIAVATVCLVWVVTRGLRLMDTISSNAPSAAA